ncbi:hypothetical protein EDC30_102248 [Paucimonas lemoignei]|uniref:Lysis protein n=2 Tax=Paucimonas lemoignei TaxID=29443 RepID=A0A4R3I3K4_PAULE|nr:hypothetical protein EDC30_102248 [Paucimonas lemoignei]
MFTFAAIGKALTSSTAKNIYIAIVISVVAWGLDQNGYSRAQSKYELQIATENEKRAETERIAEQKRQAKRDAEARNVLQLSGELLEAKEQIDALKNKLNERAKDVSTQYRPQPAAALVAIPQWIVTNGWVCDYDRAIGYGVPGAAGADIGGVEIQACAADPFERSSIEAEQILRHHEEYGAYCRKLEEQLDRVLRHVDFIEGNAAR